VQRCFIIQPFDNGGIFDRRFDETIGPAVRNAGLEPYRVDRDPQVTIPIDEIETGIHGARACLADISLDNPNVWFELGFAIASSKDVVLICSDERQAKFPFDVQHRSIIRYQTGSAGAFANLAERITERLLAISSKQQSIAQFAAASPIAATEGLSQHEVVALVMVMKNRLTPDATVLPDQVREDMLKAGHTEIATALALENLQRKHLIEAREVQDDRGYVYPALAITVEGIEWLLANQDKLVLEQPRPEPSPYDDDNLPF
jgi:hypothetical protein